MKKNINLLLYLKLYKKLGLFFFSWVFNQIPDFVNKYNNKKGGPYWLGALESLKEPLISSLKLISLPSNYLHPSSFSLICFHFIILCSLSLSLYSQLPSPSLITRFFFQTHDFSNRTPNEERSVAFFFVALSLFDR